ncbi:unnamed protein product [Heligmosomoides polygyrus]|uniref:Uncharacterized protein n=1 Tax=Heligmosomoides polygyrus TaxID=6339 RepID=A0A183GQN6_HELPZ|nr:unnamed protein product [Heligmosomoides polygyrus]
MTGDRITPVPVAGVRFFLSCKHDAHTVKGGKMHPLLFLAAPFHKWTNDVYGIDSATPRHEATLVVGNLDDVTNAPINNSLKIFMLGKRIGR